MLIRISEEASDKLDTAAANIAIILKKQSPGLFAPTFTCSRESALTMIIDRMGDILEKEAQKTVDTPLRGIPSS